MNEFIKVLLRYNQTSPKMVWVIFAVLSVYILIGVAIFIYQLLHRKKIKALEIHNKIKLYPEKSELAVTTAIEQEPSEIEEKSEPTVNETTTIEEHATEPEIESPKIEELQPQTIIIKPEDEVRSLIDKIETNFKARQASFKAMSVRETTYDDTVKQQSLYLHYEFSLHYLEYRKKFQKIIDNKADYLQYLLPIIHFTEEGVERITYYPLKFEEELQPLFTYWDAGYREASSIVLMIFLLAYKKPENWQRKLIELYAYYDFPLADKHLVEFYFQDLLDKSIAASELNLRLLDNDVIVKQLKYSLSYNDDKIIWHRSEFNHWLSFIFDDPNSVIDKKSYIKKLEPILEQKLTPMGYADFVLNKRETFTSSWRERVFRQVFQHGSYKRLQSLSKNDILYREILKPGSQQNIGYENVKEFFHLKEYEDFHLFYYLYQIDRQDPRLKEFSFTYNMQIYDNEKNSAVVSPSTIYENAPLLFRWIFYLYLGINEKWKEVSEIYHKLKIYQKEFYADFYYARSLFNMGDIDSAWSLCFALWKKDPMNLLLMNEAAIYAHYSGRQTEADEIFSQMKKLYPDHPVTLHNEAIYFEKKAKEEINDRWKKYQEVSGETVLEEVEVEEKKAISVEENISSPETDDTPIDIQAHSSADVDEDKIEIKAVSS